MFFGFGGGTMGRILDPLNLFKLDGGTKPTVQPALPAPSVNDPEVEEAKRKERELSRMRRGRAGTLLTGPSGLSESDSKKTTLLGG